MSNHSIETILRISKVIEKMTRNNKIILKDRVSIKLYVILKKVIYKKCFLTVGHYFFLRREVDGLSWPIIGYCINFT